MAWSKPLSQLRDALAILIPFREDVLPILADAGINAGAIALPQTPITLWYNILFYADSTNQLNELVDKLLIRFPNNPYLKAFKEKITYDLGPNMDNIPWKAVSDKKALEKIIGPKSTLLPIGFLQQGVKRARSVARILIETAEGTEAGTGFLLPGNILLTNHHVFPDAAVADKAIIQFSYELGENKLPLQPVEFHCDTAKGFGKSEQNDWAAVRLKEDANAQFGSIELKKIAVKKDDFVNIIQHPGGRYKQIGMYHNMVTYSDDNIVQYLTDTEPGSSGSPVFNSDWNVVALHHSGGMIPEPGSGQNLLRNEGINISVVIDGLKAANLLS